MDVYALFDNISCEKIDLTLLRPGNKTNVVEITYLSSVPDNIRESFDIGIKESYLLLLEYSDQIPEKISVWYRGFDKNSRGNSTDLAFSLSLAAHFANNGILRMTEKIDIISATGIIKKDGGINKVIGLKNKILAAIDINSINQKHLLFYPEENHEELDALRKDMEFDTKIGKSGIQLVPVKTLRDAFEYMGFIDKSGSRPVVRYGKKLVAGTGLIVLVCVFISIYALNGNNKMPLVTDNQNVVTATPGGYTAFEKTGVMYKCTPTSTYVLQSNNTSIVMTVNTPSPKAKNEKPEVTATAKADISPDIKLNDDNSITLSFREAVNNSLAHDGALNSKNYKLIDCNSRITLPDDGGRPEIFEIEPGLKYKIVFQKLIHVDSLDFILKINNIGKFLINGNMTDEITFAFKTNDTKQPYILVGPKAKFDSEWKIILVFSEEMDRASAENYGNYMLEDSSENEKYFLSELDAEIKLLNDKKTVEISLPDVEPGKDSLKVTYVTDNSKQKNKLIKDDLNVPMGITN